MLRHLCLLLTLVLGLWTGKLPAWGQQSVVDSLLREIPKLPSEKEKTKAFLRLVEVVPKDSLKLYYADRAFLSAQNAHNDSLVARTCLLLGYLLQKTPFKQEAENYYLLAIHQAQKMGWRDFLYSAHAELAAFYNRIGVYDKALKHHYESLKLAELSGDAVKVANVRNDIARVYSNLGKHEEAIKLYEQALATYEQQKDTSSMATTLNNLGIEYMKLKQYQKAIEILRQSAHYYEKSGRRRMLSYPYNNLGDVYLALHEYDKSFAYYQKALEIDQQNQDAFGVAIGYLSLAKVYHAQQDYHNALLFLSKAIAYFEQHQAADYLFEAYPLAIDCYRKLGKYEQAVEYYDLYTCLKEEVLSKEKLKYTEAARFEYESALKAQKIKILEQEKSIAQLKERQQLYLNYILGVVLLFAVGLSALYYRRYVHNKQLRQDLEKQKAIIEEQNYHLSQLNQTKDMLFSIISHDIRSPLNSLVGFLDVISTQAASFSKEEMVMLLHRLSASVYGLRELIDNLLMWARSQSDSIRFSPITFDLNQTIHRVIALFQQNAAQKDIHVHTELSGSLELTADPQMVAFIVRNLVSNALKFTSSGGDIYLKAYTQDHKCYIHVKDTGIGIPAEDITKLFKQNEIYSRKGTNNERGSGLGLKLAYQFIKQHGGTIEVHSREGEGTEFIVTLPLNPSNTVS
ncbi:signal transduction histidine kinase [Thermonema lapsum]|uniref:histidine kinase n=1 Tax=Thermonema lapsum TaxID=28195 RepID=A0A846MU94_9BACT|nr:tetratricopeptide repeat protein [Thermonema lapsum]NIK74902.1 signal transduction histidine kinase [Thermonema lapsum]